jgi:hypothetical protein
MAELIGIPLDGGGVVVVEVGDARGLPVGLPGGSGAGRSGPDGVVPDGVVKAGRPAELVGRAVQSLEGALEPVARAARSMAATLREAGPDEVKVEFGVQLTAEAGAVITRTTGECNLQVTMCWRRDGSPTNEPPPT